METEKTLDDYPLAYGLDWYVSVIRTWDHTPVWNLEVHPAMEMICSTTSEDIVKKFSRTPLLLNGLLYFPLLFKDYLDYDVKEQSPIIVGS